MDALELAGTDIASLLTLLFLAAARPLGFILILPVFARFQLNSGVLRGAILVAIVMPLIPGFFPLRDAAALLSFPVYALITMKELLIGLILGILIGVPFWAAQAAGDIIDFQRSASIGSTIDPASGEDTTVSGTLMFLILLLLLAGSGQMTEVLLGGLYESYTLWPLLSPLPDLEREAIFGLLAAIFRVGLVLGLPIVGALLTIELAIALATKYVTQINPFFLSMGVKQIVFVLLLPVYFAALTVFMGGELRDLADIVDTLGGFRAE